MTTPAIAVDDVSKRFRIAHERYQSLKERVVHFGRRSQQEDFWALQNVDVDIPPGQTVGLLGHNGSGKSTLLKCVAGILRPTSGEIRTVGRVAALLELGAGFNGELTGRENVYMNGTILGLSKKEIAKRFDEIVAFAELEQFIDTQVRFYSSGMYVRLGFAVAVNVDPEILLVDEVLAVGDEAFQRKCLKRVEEFQREGRTIVVVTHSPDLVRSVCDRAVVLDHGHKVADGDPTECVRIFREKLFGAAEGEISIAKTDRHSEPIFINGVEIRFPTEKPWVAPGESLLVRATYYAEQPFDGARLLVNVHDLNGTFLFGTDTDTLGTPLGTVEGMGEMHFIFDPVVLLDGAYELSFAIIGADGETISHWREQFLVKGGTGSSRGYFDIPMQAVMVDPITQERIAG